MKYSRHPILSLAIMAAALILANSGCSPSAREARHLSRGNRYFADSRYPEAIIEYLNVLRINPTNTAAIRGMGLANYQTGDARSAIQFLLMALQSQPEDVDLRIKAGTLYRWAGQVEDALTQVDQILQRDPKNLEALLLMADCSYTPDTIKEAFERLENVRSEFEDRMIYHLALGNLFLRQRRPQEAVQAYTEAIARDPKSTEPHMALARLYRMEGKSAQADAEFKAASELAPLVSPVRVAWADFKLLTGDTNGAVQILTEITAKEPDYIPACFRLAQVAFAERRFPDCRGLLDRILAKEPSHADALLLHSRIQLAHNETAKARKELEALTAKYPRFAPAHYFLAVACLRMKDSRSALDELKQAIAIRPDFEDPAILSAEINLQAGNADAAIEDLKRLLLVHPRSARALTVLGTAYRAKRMPDKAVTVYRDLIKLQPDSPQAHFLLGLALRVQGKADEAGREFETALTIAPDFSIALAQWVDMSTRGKRYDEAIRRINQQIEKSPKTAEYWFLLGQTYSSKGDTDKAEEAFLKCIELKPLATQGYLALSRLYAASGRDEQAMVRAQDALKVNPEDVPSLMIGALLHERAGRYEEARAWYEKVLKINPSFAPAANNLAYVLSEHFQDVSNARKYAQNARDNAPQDPYIADTLGWILYRQGEYQWAISLLMESADRLDDRPEYLYHLGMAQYSLGQEDAARRSFERALALSQDFAGMDEARRILGILSTDMAGTEKPEDVQEKLAEHADSPAALVRMGLIDEQKGSLAEARSKYEQVLAANPKYVPGMVGLARVLLMENREQTRAFELAKLARSLAPKDPEAAAVLGRVALQQENYPWALSLLRESAPKLQDDPETQYQLGMAYYMMGHVDTAVQQARGALESGAAFHSADDARLFVGLASPATPGNEEADAQKVLETRPGYLPALMARAAELCNTKPEEAGAFYEKIIKIYPRFSPALRDSAWLSALTGKADDAALSTATRARDMLPEDPKAAGALGMLYQLKGNNVQASRLLQESVSSLPDIPILQYRLGMARAAAGDKASARASLEKALQLDPSSALAEEARRILAGL